MLGSAAVELASCFMIDRALTAGAPSVILVASGFSTVPPALDTIVLNQTVAPSYCAPWISMRCALPSLASFSASAIISAQVAGGFGTRSDRYHSSWVLVLSGTATSWPFQVAVFRAGTSVPATACALYVPVHGSIQPAVANSASQVTSRPMM